jgi:hypothetical protein
VTLQARVDGWMRSGRSSNLTRPVDIVTMRKEANEKPYLIWIMNAIRGLPTSEDLRKTYFWESRRLGKLETESLSVIKRKSRMQRLWRVQWYGTVEMLIHNKKSDSSEWRIVFLMVQGHRLLWWRSINDFDSGIPPMGRLFLAGHAGLSSPSPLELREINGDDIDQVVCVFGSGSRVTILTSSLDSKFDLERSIETALLSKKD